MKHIIYLLLIVTWISNTVAQEISADKVPAKTMSAFKTKFPGATKPTWELENPNEYEASFKLNGKEVSANFDGEGKWLETETEIKASELPQAVIATLRKDFSDFKINEASKIESVKHGKCFETELEKGSDKFDALFNPDGKLLEKTKEVEDKGDKD